MAAAAPIIGIIGTIVGAVGTIASGQAQQRAANFQAAQLEQQATQELALSQREAYEYRENKKRALSRQQAVAATSGLSASDPDVLYLAGETAARGRYQEEMALYSGQARKQNLELNAQAVRMGGAAAAQGSLWSAAGTVLGGFATFYDKYGRIAMPGGPLDIRPPAQQFIYR